MNKVLFTAVVALCFVVAPVQKTNALTQGEYQSWGTMSAVGGVACIVVGISNWSQGEKYSSDANKFPKGSDEEIALNKKGDTYRERGALFIIGGAVLGGIAAYCFNQNAKEYGAIFDYDNAKGRLVLGFPAVTCNAVTQAPSVVLLAGRY